MYQAAGATQWYTAVIVEVNEHTGVSCHPLPTYLKREKEKGKLAAIASEVSPVHPGWAVNPDLHAVGLGRMPSLI